MISSGQYARLKPLFIFFAAYTVGFYLFAATLKYTFPFLAGFLLALSAQPAIRWLKRRLHMPSAPAAALATLLTYAAMFGIIFLLGYWLIYEISNLFTFVSGLSASTLNQVMSPLNQIISLIGGYVSNIDANFIKENQQNILNIAQSGIGMTTAILGGILRFLTSLPAIMTMLIVMIFSTYFFSKDMSALRRNVKSLLPVRAAENIRECTRSGKKLSWRYFGSYLLIYFITFIETLIVYSVLGVPYPLVLSMVTGIADILPVFGPGTIYIPLALIYLVQAHYFTAAALMICWLLISAIRQIIEPKIVSSSINVHPLSMLAAIYFALISGNFWLLIYFSLLMILYQILTSSGVLPTLFIQTEKKKNGAPAK